MKNNQLKIDLLLPADCALISKCFQEIGWNKPVSQFKQYYQEQIDGKRDTFVITMGSHKITKSSNTATRSRLMMIWFFGLLKRLETIIKMTNAIEIRHPTLKDESAFLKMTNESVSIHHPWIKAPLTSVEYAHYLKRFSEPNQISFLAFSDKNIIGVFNLSEIVRGCFQNAFLGFYGSVDIKSKGFISAALKLVLEQAFTTIKLHRIEANIQPENGNSIRLIRKNGFRKEGFSPRYLQINDRWCDHERWAITIEDWNSR